MDINETLRQAIRDDPRSYCEMAKDVGVAVQTLTRYVSGKSELKMTQAAKVAEDLGLVLVRRVEK